MGRVDEERGLAGRVVGAGQDEDGQCGAGQTGKEGAGEGLEQRRLKRCQGGT